MRTQVISFNAKKATLERLDQCIALTPKRLIPLFRSNEFVRKFWRCRQVHRNREEMAVSGNSLKFQTANYATWGNCGSEAP